jgi:hypothetical protein
MKVTCFSRISRSQSAAMKALPECGIFLPSFLSLLGKGSTSER